MSTLTWNSCHSIRSNYLGVHGDVMGKHVADKLSRDHAVRCIWVGRDNSGWVGGHGKGVNLRPWRWRHVTNCDVTVLTELLCTLSTARSERDAWANPTLRYIVLSFSTSFWLSGLSFVKWHLGFLQCVFVRIVSGPCRLRGVMCAWFVWFCVYCLLVMAALRCRCGHYIFALWFLSSIFFYSSPKLNGHWLDVYHTSTHGVALVWI